ncbi:MAG: DUF1905 domain-containing protein [Fimbriimonadaceae bacterium]|nr:DUF1905 domain-containing protein [Fimbriimonadaceae bacterium]QYK59006.1 MAG: DUF1905 domain-containing protein [Fimbriimonadaceae bacterium]
MTVRWKGEVWYWKGPAPHHFITVPPEESREIKAGSSRVTYGWGMIPVLARIGQTDFTTAMFEKNGAYVLPVKLAVRKREGIEVGDSVLVEIVIEIRAP